MQLEASRLVVVWADRGQMPSLCLTSTTSCGAACKPRPKSFMPPSPRHLLCSNDNYLFLDRGLLTCLPATLTSVIFTAAGVIHLEKEVRLCHPAVKTLPIVSITLRIKSKYFMLTSKILQEWALEDLGLHRGPLSSLFVV